MSDDTGFEQREMERPETSPESICPRVRHQGLGLDGALPADRPVSIESQGELREGAPAHRGMSRRRFLSGAALGAAGLAVGPHLLIPGRSRASRHSSTVVRVYHPGATTGWTTVNQGPVDLMVHTAIRVLTGIPATGAAWKSLFPGITAAHRIGIKINLSCGDVPTHPAVVNSIIDGLLMMDLGGQQLPEEQIVVWDMDNPFFCAQTGYTVNYGGPGVQYYGTDHAGVGYDTTRTFTIQHPLGSTSNHHPSKIITQRIDFMINAGVIKDHSDAGVTGCLKNNYGSFDNIGIYQTHVSGTYGDGHTRGEPELNRVLRDELGDKTKLFLIDGTFGLFSGGPGYIPPYHTPPNWAYNSVLVGLDPVAIDRIETVKINEKRVQQGLGTLNPSHVSASAQAPYDLGTDNPAEIDLVEIDASSADVPETPGDPAGMMMLAPCPNPTTGPCTVRLRCAETSRAEVVIADARGAVVRRLAARDWPQGTHGVPWDGKDDRGRSLPCGTYFCRLITPRGRQHQRVVIVR